MLTRAWIWTNLWVLLNSSQHSAQKMLSCSFRVWTCAVAFASIFSLSVGKLRNAHKGTQTYSYDRVSESQGGMNGPGTAFRDIWILWCNQIFFQNTEQWLEWMSFFSSIMSRSETLKSLITSDTRASPWNTQCKFT